MIFKNGKNTASKLNDEIILEAFPSVNLIELTGFTDSTSGTSSDKFFEKYFSYSLDGINYSNWALLTNLNLQGIQFYDYSIFCIKYKYIRKGIDDTGVLTLNSVTLSGTNKVINTPEYNNTIFSEYFDSNNPEVLNWAVNVVQKLYHPGIIPNYIERDEENVTEFVSYWFALTHFLSILVSYTRIFALFDQNIKILSQYLSQKGLFIDKDNTLVELTTLMKNFYLEISKRGSFAQVAKKADSDIGVNGEVLRLVSYKETDEFLFALSPAEKVGWNLGNSSPLYKGLYRQMGLFKGYEDTKDIINITKYPIKDDEGSVTIVDDGDKSVLQINSVTGKAGIGYEGGFDFSKGIVIDNNLDYKIEFKISLTNQATEISFGALALDLGDNIVSLKSVIDDSDTNFFLEEENTGLQEDKYFTVRGIIYNRQQINITDYGKLNINKGKNLIFKDDVVKIIPFVLGTNTDADFKIWDFKVTPLRAKYSLGFIQTNRLIQTYFINNTDDQSISDIFVKFRRYFTLYNTWIKYIDSTNIVDTNHTSTTTIVPTIWVPNFDTAYCEIEYPSIFGKEFKEEFE